MPEAVIVIGDQEFEADALKQAEGGDEYYLLKFVGDVAEEIARVARTLAPKRSGLMAMEGITHEMEPSTPHTARAVAGVLEEPHGAFVVKGTGVFGEFHGNIRPLKGNVLAFDVDGHTVFARTVKGQRPNPFFQEAVILVENTYLPVKLGLLGHELAGS